jgi:hypothetical protein
LTAASSGQTLFSSVSTNIFCDAHGAEVGTAHGTKVSGLGAFLRQGFVVKFARGFGIERQIELILTGSPRPANPPSRVTFDVIYPVAPFATVFPPIN